VNRNRDERLSRPLVVHRQDPERVRRFGKQLIRVVGLLDELADEVVLESRERFDEVGLARPLAVEPVLAVHSLEEMDVVPAAATEPL